VKPISLALKAHYASGSRTLATCWKATRTDGVIVASTSLNRDLVIDGLTYLARAGYTHSQITNGSQLAPDNLELEGILASPLITEEDLRAGRWDYAKVEIFEINFEDLAAGKLDLRTGTLGEVRAGRTKFVAELRGLLQHLSRRIVQLVTATCPYDLGDAGCKVNLAAVTVTGTVDSVASAREFTDAARTEATDWFTGAKVLWLTGQNAGLSMEVSRSTSAGVFTLHHFMPYPIAPGDTYSVPAGCAKRFTEDCVGKFANGINFGGDEDLPGSDTYAGPENLQ
jgi:uncharacterized phage protein (TIGR02218 family)